MNTGRQPRPKPGARSFRPDRRGGANAVREPADSPLISAPARGTEHTEWTFLLGTHRAHWLWNHAVPLCIADHHLHSHRSLRAALSPWMLDSGAFTQIQRHGDWSHAPTPAEYVDRARRYTHEIGHLTAIAPQDWCCEPQAIAGGRIGRVDFAGTGLTVREHQHRTVDNVARLRELAPELPFMPVLQGWTVHDYLRCLDFYAAAGFDLATEPLVGVGSICRRQASADAARIFAEIVDAVPSIRLHAFGVKLAGLGTYGSLTRSSDSMAWSKAAVHVPPLPGCHHRHCGNCATYALRWRARVIAAYHAHRQHPRGIQLDLRL